MSSAVVVGYKLLSPGPVVESHADMAAKIVDVPTSGGVAVSTAEISGGPNTGIELLLLSPSGLGATQLSFGQVSPLMHPYTYDPGMAQSGSEAPQLQSHPSFAL